ncbi:hypothetical protein AB0M87_04075 [Streptomyces sp. NPDC051320]|uniref:hypothetical protein n=1 Tax=Streptomyces sp. NPDC051320 TaxID=3154644 RepID=UPI00342DC680
MGTGTKRRPTDWQPLGDTDPTPGDVDGVTAGQKNMQATAAEIRLQIKKLKTISDDKTLKGKYVDELQSGADKFRGKLEKSAGRYERVSAQLEKWATDLKFIQTSTADALSSAKSAQADIKKLVGSTDPDSEAAKKAEDELDSHKKEQLHRARSDLAAAQRKYQHAIESYDTQSKNIAKKIRDIIDDALEDGFWSWVSNIIEANIDAIKITLEVIGYVATIAAIVALAITVLAACIVMPELLLALAPMLLTFGTVASVVSLGMHTLMAATGNGGWGDVGFDILGLLTFKAGGAVARGVEEGAAATQRASTQAARRATADAMANSPKREALKLAVQQAKGKNARRAASKNLKAYNVKLKAKGAAQQLPKPTAREVLNAGGDPKTAAQLKYAAREEAKRGSDTATLKAARQTSRAGAQNLSLFVSGTAIDLGDKAVGSSDISPSKPNIKPYSDAKDWNFYNSGLYDYAP